MTHRKRGNVKLINYYRGIGTPFDCVIHGTIYMTYTEWYQVKKWLLRCTKPFQYYDDGQFRKSIFLKDITIGTHKYGEHGFCANIRVTPTEYLVKKYHLNGYKRGNYQIVVTP